MNTFLWIIGSGLVMSAIAMVGSITLVLKKGALKKILLQLVAFAAGSLIGGAFFHMIPASLEYFSKPQPVFLWLTGGFIVFFVLEQFLHWHHCHQDFSEQKEPVGYLILIADGVHNLLGGLAVGGAFMIDIRLGITTWLAAAAHEVPQELGDFAVLINSGWKKSSALLFNLLSGLTFLVGQLIAFFLSAEIAIEFLIPFAAGNFLYIGASDLIPQVNRTQTLKEGFLIFSLFLLGLAFLYWLGN